MDSILTEKITVDTRRVTNLATQICY